MDKKMFSKDVGNQYNIMDSHMEEVHNWITIPFTPFWAHYSIRKLCIQHYSSAVITTIYPHNFKELILEAGAPGYFYVD